MKSKRRLLLAALLMVVMAALLTVPALANPKLNKKKLTLKVGQKTRLKVKGTKDKVTWDSSNLEVVYVDDTGKIWADKPGKVTITAKVGGKKLKCKVTVKAKKTKPTPTPTSTPTPKPPVTPVTYTYREVIAADYISFLDYALLKDPTSLIVRGVWAANTSEYEGVVIEYLARNSFNALTRSVYTVYYTPEKTKYYCGATSNNMYLNQVPNHGEVGRGEELDLQKILERSKTVKWQ